MSESDRNASLASSGAMKFASSATESIRCGTAGRATVGATRRNVARSYRRKFLRSARGYVFFAQKDFASAADELSADPRSPLTLKWLAIARQNAAILRTPKPQNYA